MFHTRSSTFFCRCIFGTRGCKVTQQNRTNCKLCRYQVKIYEAVKIANVKGGGRKSPFQIKSFSKKKRNPRMQNNHDDMEQAARLSISYWILFGLPNRIGFQNIPFEKQDSHFLHKQFQLPPSLPLVGADPGSGLSQSKLYLFQNFIY